MPRKTDLRVDRAIELLERIARGPASVCVNGSQELKNAYSLWVQSWVLQNLIELQPELYELYKAGKLENKLSDGEARRIISERYK